MNQLTEYRREFHKYPENGWREFRTSARVAEILTGMGYDVAMGPDVIEPGSVGEPERLSEEQIRQEMERAVRQPKRWTPLFREAVRNASKSG